MGKILGNFVFLSCRVEHTDLQSHWLATLFWEALRVAANGKGHFPFFEDNTQELDLQSVFSQPCHGARLNFVQEVKVAGGEGAKFRREKTQPHGTDTFSLCRGCLPARASLLPLLWDGLWE